MDQLAERLAQHVRELRNFVRGHDLQDLSDVVRLGRARPRKALEDDDAERPNVSAVVDVPLAEDLLWRHVILGSEHHAGSREPSSVRAVVVSRRELGDAEVEHLDDWPVWRLREEDVVRLKIAVDDPARARCADRRNHWQEDPREFPNRQDGLAIEAAPPGDSPRSSSITIIGVVSSSSRTSWITTMFGCCTAQAARASRKNRCTRRQSRSPDGSKSFSATGLRVTTCIADHTTPIPPSLALSRVRSPEVRGLR